MTWRYDEPDFLEDLPPRCSHPGCPKPGRFFLGHGVLMYTWCIDHIEPEGYEHLRHLIDGLRDIIRSTDLPERDPERQPTGYDLHKWGPDHPDYDEMGQ